MPFYLLAFPPPPVGKARFDSSAKLAGWPRMRVPPYLGGSPPVFLSFRLQMEGGHCTSPIEPPQIQKKTSASLSKI